MDGCELGWGAEARELGLALARDRRRSRYEGGKREGGVWLDRRLRYGCKSGWWVVNRGIFKIPDCPLDSMLDHG